MPQKYMHELGTALFGRDSLVDIVTHVLIMSLFVSCLFFFYTSVQIGGGVRALLTSLQPPPTATTTLPNVSLPASLPVSPACDDNRYAATRAQIAPDRPPYTYAPNTWIVAATFGAWFLVFTILVLYVFFTNTHKSERAINIGHILGSNVALFLCLGGLEFLFLWSVFRYVPFRFVDLSNAFFDRLKTTTVLP